MPYAKSLLRVLKRASVVLIGFTVSLAAYGQDRSMLEEVVVTAQKREQNIQDVGIAISAFTGEQIRDLGVKESFDIATFVPGVHISGNLAGQNTQFTIRGVTQNDFNDIVESPNAMYLDEGYIAIAQAQTFTVFDMERVEILKGPQGTLFGRNATGGMVQYISVKPNMEEFEGFVDASYGQYDTDDDPNNLRLEGGIGGPITEGLGFRVSGMYIDQDPYLENNFNSSANAFGAGTFGGDNSPSANAPGPDAGADMGDNETTAIRGILQWEPSDELRFMFMGNWSDTDVATGPYQSKPTSAVYTGSNPVAGEVLSQGELTNIIDTAPNDSRLSICADGSDCGSDQDNNGAPDDLNGDGLVDQGRITNQFQLSPGTDFFGYLDPDGDGWETEGDFAFADSGNTETWNGHMRIEWDFVDDILFTSVTDYKDYEKLLFIDVDSAPVNQSANFGGVDADSFTQEFRLNSETDNMRWVAGFYFLNIDTTSKNGLKFPINGVVPGPDPNLPPGPFDLTSDATLETDSYSLFGQIEYDLAEQWMLTVGGRVILEEKDYIFQQNVYYNSNSRTAGESSPDAPIPGAIPIGPVGIPPNAGAFVDDSDDTLWAGKVQLDWTPNDDWLWYFGINRGVKAGSFNAQLAGGLPIPNSDIPYEEEILWSYELGFKSSWMDDRTRFNGAVYYYDYEDYQAFLFTGVGGVVINADSETYGIELEVQTTPVDGLDLILSGSWVDAEVQDVPFRPPVFDGNGDPIGNIIVRDVEPTYTPEFQLAGMARYEWPLFGGYAAVMGDFSYSDSFYYNLRNFDGDEFDSYTLWNARAQWQTEDNRWTIALDFRNITDESAGIQGFDLATLCGCNEVSYRHPRMYGINVRYQY